MKKIWNLSLGVISSGYFFVNTVFWCSLFYPLILCDLLVGRWVLHPQVKWIQRNIAEMWISTNNLFILQFLRVKLILKNTARFQKKSSYLVISNHRSWADILVLQMSLNRKIPFLRFFIKDNLKWIPLLGTAWKSLDYPFMKRYSREVLKKFPQLRGRDLDTAREACRKMKGIPVSMLVFLEGTRWTEAKAKASMQAQASFQKYKNLLQPKTGGMAATLEELGEQISSLIDVTIVYPNGRLSFWDLMSGRLNRVIVHVREIKIPEKFRHGHLMRERELKIEFEQWIDQIWKEKDVLIQQTLMA